MNEKEEEVVMEEGGANRKYLNWHCTKNQTCDKQAEDKRLRLTRNMQTKTIMQHRGQSAEQDPGQDTHGVLSVPSDTLCLLHTQTHTHEPFSLGILYYLCPGI